MTDMEIGLETGMRTDTVATTTGMRIIEEGTVTISTTRKKPKDTMSMLSSRSRSLR